MKTGGIIGIIVVVLIVIIGVFMFMFSGNQEDLSQGSQGESPTSLVPAPGFEDVDEMIVNDGSGSENPTTLTVEITSSTLTVEITSSGFSPKTFEINAGDTVTWTNMDSRSHWPASAVHPTHTVYPEPGGCIGSKFDACKGLSNRESYSFTFNEKGTWGYHDHLRASLTGTIIVN